MYLHDSCHTKRGRLWAVITQVIKEAVLKTVMSNSIGQPGFSKSRDGPGAPIQLSSSRSLAFGVIRSYMLCQDVMNHTLEAFSFRVAVGLTLHLLPHGEHQNS